MACSISQTACSISQKACSKSQSSLGFLGFSGNPKKHNSLVFLGSGLRSLGVWFQLKAYELRKWDRGFAWNSSGAHKKSPRFAFTAAWRLRCSGQQPDPAQRPRPKKSNRTGTPITRQRLQGKPAHLATVFRDFQACSPHTREQSAATAALVGLASSDFEARRIISGAGLKFASETRKRVKGRRINTKRKNVIFEIPQRKRQAHQGGRFFLAKRIPAIAFRKRALWTGMCGWHEFYLA